MKHADFDTFLGEAKQRYPWLPSGLLKHYARLYGTRMHQLLGDAASMHDLGTPFGPLFFEREAYFLISEEWARTAEDILERRTKHGLHLSAGERHAFGEWFEQQALRAGARG
jgi:glycerol-3-phosphate dehydrogenase